MSSADLSRAGGVTKDYAPIGVCIWCESPMIDGRHKQEDYPGHNFYGGSKLCEPCYDALDLLT